MLTQEEAAQKLETLIAQSEKNNVENQKNFDDLKAAIQANGQASPEVEEKLNALEASLKKGDEITPDAPTGDTGGEDDGA